MNLIDNDLTKTIMKKIFISLMMVAAMSAAVSCACSNNSDKAAKCSTEQCASCDKKDSCGEAEGCQADATKCSEEKCPFKHPELLEGAIFNREEFNKTLKKTKEKEMVGRR